MSRPASGTGAPSSPWLLALNTAWKLQPQAVRERRRWSFGVDSKPCAGVDLGLDLLTNAGPDHLNPGMARVEPHPVQSC